MASVFFNKLGTRMWAVLIIVVGIASLASESIAQVGDAQTLPLGPLYVQTTSGRHDFKVELAVTPQQRAIGLMYRTHMGADRGMLFANGVERETGFWMKNTYIPLDIIFIHRDGRIANIAADTIPLSLESVRSAGPVFAILELNAGTSALIGLKPGDMVHHQLFGNFAANE